MVGRGHDVLMTRTRTVQSRCATGNDRCKHQSYVVVRPGRAQGAVVGSFETRLSGQGCVKLIPGAANEEGARTPPGRDLRDTKHCASTPSATQPKRLVVLWR